MVLLALIGLIAIPVIGLTLFHAYLICTGKTTNEQVSAVVCLFVYQLTLFHRYTIFKLMHLVSYFS